MAKLIREISAAGLSSREGCGNTVRNVTADPLAGICEGEVFDPTPYVGAYVRYFVRHPTTQLMPRKIKTSFDGTEGDRAISGIHDIAFHARERDGVRGFEVRVGGGTSIMPRIAPTIWEFASADDGEYMKIAEAVFRIFDRQDWLRVNRARARVKVLVDKIGAEEMTKLVEEELKGDWVERARLHADSSFFHDEEARAPAEPPRASRARTATAREFDRFVLGQRRAAEAGGLLRRHRQDHPRRPDAGAVPRPRPDHARLHGRVRAHDRAAEPDAALGPQRGALRRLAAAASSSASATPARTRSPTSSAARAPTAASSASRARWASTRPSGAHRLDGDRRPAAKRIHIKMSGCPNGCSQHHIANIGFYGASIKVGEHTIPAYVAHIGGQYEGGAVAYGTRLKVRLPAKRMPEAVERWIRFYLDERQDDEVFNAFAERVGQTAFEELVRATSRCRSSSGSRT